MVTNIIQHHEPFKFGSFFDNIKSQYIGIVKWNSARLNWCLFLAKKGFFDDGDRLINIKTMIGR